MEVTLFISLLFASVYSSPLSGNERTANKALVVTSSAHQSSPFQKIIRTNDIATRDAIYSTPAVVYVGTENKLLRCLYEEPNKCEVVFNTGDYVSSLLVSEEYIYAGLHSGMILRCNLNQKESCVNFQTGASTVWSLEKAGKYLYAGLRNGTITRCELNQRKSCRPLHNLETSVNALLYFKEYMYAGLYKGEHFVRCSLSNINSCTTVFKTNGSIFELTKIGNSILAVGSGDRLWNCTEKPESGDYCKSVTTTNIGMQDMESFNGKVYTVKYNKSINICQWPNTECSEYVRMPGVRSIAFAYSTYGLQSRYANEDTACTWQGEAMCPPGVVYYNADQRAKIQVEVKDGRLYNSVGNLVDTSNADEGTTGPAPAAIFVMLPDGRILLSNSHKRELLHTSSLFAGKPVAGAGEMTVKNGVIQEIRACSEHYRPNLELNHQVVVSLRAQGYTDHIVSVECDDNVLGQTGSENVQ